MWFDEASHLARRTLIAPGRPKARTRACGNRPYTPAMRRWVCVIALLFGFAGDGYAWTIRPRMPIPIERPIEDGTARRGLHQSGRWWQSA